MNTPRKPRKQTYLPIPAKQTAMQNLQTLYANHPLYFEYLVSEPLYPLGTDFHLATGTREQLKSKKRSYLRIGTALHRIQQTTGEGQWPAVDTYLRRINRSTFAIRKQPDGTYHLYTFLQWSTED